MSQNNTSNGWLWITWEIQRRNRTLSSALDAQLVELECDRSRLLRYANLGWRTLTMLLRRRPRLLLVQNPSMVLAILATTYGKLASVPVVVDAHNAGVFPAEGKVAWLQRVAHLVFRMADMTIVSNTDLAAYVTQHGGRAIVVPDPIPKFEKPKSLLNLPGQFNVFCPLSWGPDEPYSEIVEAAKHLPRGYLLHLTGNSDRARTRLAGTVPPNVVLTGYLEESEYVRYLYSCDAVLVLTNRNNCLTCGAYEAVAAEKPMILSDTPVLRDLFYRGALFTRNEATQIAAKIVELSMALPEMRKDVYVLKKELIAKIDDSIAKLRGELVQLCGS